MNTLSKEYIRILSSINGEVFDLKNDKYSGVFLPVPFDEYWTSDLKIMLVGRETAGWNSQTNKNTMARVLGYKPEISIEQVVDEAMTRYKQHLTYNDGRKIKCTSRSRFKQYYFRLARELNIAPQSLIYSNLFAWDYNQKTPLHRPQIELDEVISISLQLLATQITLFKPDYVIFASGIVCTDRIIKRLFNQYLGGYKTSAPVISGKLWEFKGSNATCFRIAHPRAMRGHQDYRTEVIHRILQKEQLKN